MKLEDFAKDKNEIYVLDTETTGLKGAPTDLVVDIAICRVNLVEGTVEEVYSSIVGHETSNWNSYLKNAWIFENTDLTIEMVSSARPFEQVLNDIVAILSDKCATSYNTGYDFNNFLYKEPWNLKGRFIECTDIMKAATSVCKLPSMYYDSYRYPKLNVAYETIVKGDPANMGTGQDHRALPDTKMAAYIMIQMFKDGNYLP